MNFLFASFKTSLIGIAIICLSSCSLFSPVKGPTITYVIDTVPPCLIRKPPVAITLLVNQVESGAIYNNTQMAYTEHPHQIAYFAKSGWIDTPAQMLQPLIAETLRNTHHFHAVNAAPTLGHADYVLTTQLLELKQVFFPCSSKVYLRLNAQIINSKNSHIIATKEFCVIESTPQRTPWGGAIAANRATAILLQQLAQFCLQTI